MEKINNDGLLIKCTCGSCHNKIEMTDSYFEKIYNSYVYVCPICNNYSVIDTSMLFGTMKDGKMVLEEKRVSRPAMYSVTDGAHHRK